MLNRLLKPWFIWRPQQIVLRAVRALVAPKPGYSPLTTAWGATITADPTKTIGRSIRTTAVYDLSVSEALARLIRPGDLVVDAGANVGYMTVLAAMTTGATGKVLSFEPHPELFSVLERNVAENSDRTTVATVETFNQAFGNAAGSANLVIPAAMDDNDGLAFVGEANLPGARNVTIDLTTLDEVIGERRVGVLKIDLEGFEFAVLQGARRALEERRIRDIVFEDHKPYPSRTAGLLEQLGYRIFSIHRNLQAVYLDSAAIIPAPIRMRRRIF